MNIAGVCMGSLARAGTDVAGLIEQAAQQYDLSITLGEDTRSGLSAKQRANILLDYLYQPNIEVIWALRGGEGSADVIEYLVNAQQQIAQLPAKWLIGFSDFTPVLNYFAQTHHWPVLHGPGLLQIAQQSINQADIDCTLNYLRQGLPSQLHLPATALNPLAEKINRPLSNIELLGGNLSLLALNFADHWQLNLENKLLIIEEVDELPYKISRQLKYFQRIGWLNPAAGVLFGAMNPKPIGQSEQQQQYYQVAMEKRLAQFAEHCPVPVWHSTAFGHGQANQPLPLGQTLCLHLESRIAS